MAGSPRGRRLLPLIRVFHVWVVLVRGCLGWLVVGAFGGGVGVRCALVGVRCAHSVGACVRCAHVLDGNWYVVVLLWRIQATWVLSVGGVGGGGGVPL